MKAVLCLSESFMGMLWHPERRTNVVYQMAPFIELLDKYQYDVKDRCLQDTHLGKLPN